MKSLGDYVYDEKDKLGRGLFGVVYKGHNKTNLTQVVAIKEVDTENPQNKVYPDLINRETDILKKLSNPRHMNIVTLLHYEEKTPYVYFVLEFCNGGNLQEYLKSKRKLDESAIRIFLRQIADGLKAAHDMKIIHRDLKPENILLHFSDHKDPSPDRITLKIADFGIGRFLDDDEMARTYCGTRKYMAPEILQQRRGGHDYKVDLWSVGVIAYECFVGPFQKDSDIIALHGFQNPKGATENFVNLLQGLLEDDANKRFTLKQAFDHQFLGITVSGPSDQSTMIGQQVEDMGACFCKIFNGCPLHINCTASWVHPETKDQHILFGADEGIYTLNLNEIDEITMDLLFAKPCIRLYIVKDVLMSLSGRGPSLFRHDLLMLHNRQSHRLSLTVDKIPGKLVPRKYVINAKVPDTRGCTKCCVGRNPNNGYKYLCGALQNKIFLMQWYEPLNKFMMLKYFDVTLSPQLSVFEMFIAPELEYPQICVGVLDSTDRNVEFDLINLNSAVDWSYDINSGKRYLDVVHVSQLEKDTVLICHDNVIQFHSMNGRIKNVRRHSADFRFDFKIKSLFHLPESQSVLAFHDHGMQERSLRTNKVTQEICNQDEDVIYRVIGSDRLIVLESRVTGAASKNTNLFVLAGHESVLFNCDLASKLG